jgi:transcriptional regulator with XRE-family HTH domain
VGGPSNPDLGQAIRGLRHERELTIEALGFAADIHPTYVSGIERGRRNPTWTKLRALANVLEVSVADVVRRAESATRVREGVERVIAEEEARHDSHRTSSWTSLQDRGQREATWSSRGRGLPSMPRELLPSHSRRSERMVT